MNSRIFFILIFLLITCFTYLNAQDLGPDEELYLRDPDPRYHGEKVEALQRFLLFSGINIGPDGIDGWFGKDTENALKKYQQQNRLEVTGRIKFGDIPAQLGWNPLVIPTVERGLDEGPFPGEASGVKTVEPVNGSVQLETYYGKLEISAAELDNGGYHKLRLSPDERFVAGLGLKMYSEGRPDFEVKIWDILTGHEYVCKETDVIRDWQTGEILDKYSVTGIERFFWNRDEISVNGELRLIIIAGVNKMGTPPFDTVVLVYPWRQTVK
jgi:hypothetical protein